MRTYIIYKTTNTINGHFYLGAHSGNKDSYLGSGTVLNKAIKKYGRDAFIRETLAEFDSKEEMYDYERWLVNDVMVGRYDCYNIMTGGGNHSYASRPMSEITRKNLVASFSRKKKTMSPGAREKLRQKALGRKMSEECVEAMRIRNKGEGNPMYGRRHSASTKQKFYEDRAGVKQKKTTCPKCGLTGGVSNMSRYHFDNCTSQIQWFE